MNKRISKFDNAKFVLIFLVVLGHFADYYVERYDLCRLIFIFVYSFHMPTFIFLKGFFFKKYEKINVKKILYYIVLAILVKFFIFVAQYKNEGNIFYFLGGSDADWYLITISVYYLLFPLIKRFNFKFLLPFSFLLSLIVGYDENINIYFHLSRIIVFFPFYLIGYNFLTCKSKILKILDSKITKLISLIILILFCFIALYKFEELYSYRMLFTAKNPYSWIQICKHGFINRILCYITSFIIGFCFLSLIPSRKIRFITTFGSRTLQVYVLHLPLLIIFMRLSFINDIISNNKICFYIILLIIPLLVTIVLSLSFFEKVFCRFKQFIFDDN